MINNRIKTFLDNNKDNNKRYTIGLLIEDVEGIGGYQSSIWSGVVNAAKKRDVNLVCFAGGMLDDYNRNGIYELITKEILHGVIINNSISNTVSRKKLLDFLFKLGDLPIVSIANPIPEIASVRSVLVDNEKDLQRLLEHLINDHHKKRIAFIKGPKGNEEAEQRFKTYCQVLKKNKIEVVEELIVSGDYRPQSGKMAINTLQKRNVEYDAIVAANDNMAIGSIKALIEFKKDIPKNISIVGYDDIEEARSTNPPLTTIWQPRYQQGERALELLLDIIEKKEVNDVTLTTELKIRQSCGCKTPSHSNNQQQMINMFSVEKFMSGFFECINCEIQSKTDQFLHTFETELRKIAEDYGDMSGCQDKLNELRYEIFSKLTLKKSKQAEKLWDNICSLFTEIIQQIQISKKVHVENQSAILRDISETLTTTVDINKLMDALKNKLLLLGIPSCYIALYKDIRLNDLKMPEQVELIFLYKNKKRLKSKQNVIYNPQQLLMKILSRSPNFYSMVLEPLYFHDNQFGFALFEQGPCEGVIYEALRSQISSALEVTSLFRQLEEERNYREKKLDSFNKMLENVTIHAIELIGQGAIGDLSSEALSFINEYFNSHAALYIIEKRHDNTKFLLEGSNPPDFEMNLKKQWDYSLNNSPYLYEKRTCDENIVIGTRSTRGALEGYLVIHKTGDVNSPAKPFEDSEMICFYLLANAIGYTLKKLRVESFIY